MIAQRILLIAICLFVFPYSEQVANAQETASVNINAQVLERVAELFVSPFAEPVVLGETSVLINGGEEYCVSKDVLLFFSAKGAYQLKVSNSPSFSGSKWEPYKDQKKWKLSAEDGIKTVYVQFKNISGFASETVSDNIILDSTPPSNVSDLEEKSGDGSITLSWKNPAENDFTQVKIFRSDVFFPSEANQGILIYEGKGEFFRDEDLENGKKYYYTVFSRDGLGNQSSGAVVFGIPASPDLKETEPEYFEPVQLEPETTIFVEKIKINDFEFIQEKKIKIKQNNIKVQTGKPLTVSIGYEKMPQVLKTIIVTLEKGSKEFSFLLQLNEEETAYTAAIYPPEIAGIYPLTITIFDYKNRIIKNLEGTMEVLQGEDSFVGLYLIPWYYRLRADRVLLALGAIALLVVIGKNKKFY